MKNNPQMDPADFQKLTNEKQQLLTQMYGVTGYSKIRAIKDELVKLIEESRAERGVALSKKEIGKAKAAPSAGMLAFLYLFGIFIECMSEAP